MKLISLKVGLHLILDQATYRIIKITENDQCYLERIKDLAILSYKKEELIRLYAEGKIIFQGSNESITPANTEKQQKDFSQLSESQKKRALKRYAYIQEAEKYYVEPCCRNFKKLIKHVSLKINDPKPLSSISLYRWWSRWYHSGRDIRVLANRNPGCKGHRKFNDDFKAIFNEVLNENYLIREKCSKYAFHLTLCSKILLHNQTAITPINTPSRATTYRMLSKLDLYTVMASQHGYKKADQYFRVVGKGVHTKYILERVEIDHTPLDIIVISEETKLPIGRPYLTCLFEVGAKMPLGIEIGFEPPSYLSVIRALKQAILPKNEITHHYPDIQHIWPAFGIPTTLVCDNGLEFHSEQLNRVCSELNIELIYCPKHEPNYKGSIERFLGTLNSQVCHRLKGTTFSNINKRGDYKSANEACITLEKLKEIIYLWLIDDYCQSPHKALKATPFLAWQDGLKKIEPILPESKQALELILGYECKRKLSHQGIQFLHLFYNAEELRTIRRYHSSNTKVSIRINLENLGSIWVYDEYSAEYILIRCTEPDYAEGLSLQQHRSILKERIRTKSSLVPQNELLALKESVRQKIHQANHSKSLRKQTRAKRVGTIQSTTAYDSNFTLIPQYHEIEPSVEDFDIPSFKVIECKEEE